MIRGPEDGARGPARNGKLPTLAAASDPEAMRAVLQQALPARGPVAAVGVEILRRRKRRCVLRYRVAFQTGGTDSFIGKVFRGERGHPVHALMVELASQGFAPDAADGVSIPAVAAYLPELSLLLQEEVGGLPVKECVGTPASESALRRMGAAVAKLHRSPVRPGSPWELADHLGRCRPAPHALQEALPELREPVDSILATSARLLRDRRASEWALIHGDLHLAQVHVSEPRTWLIDLDACCVADPAADLGNLLVFLQAKARRRDDGRRLRDAFLDAYFARMPADILGRVPIFTALTHVRRACKRMRLREKNWRKKACRAVEAGLRSLAEA